MRRLLHLSILLLLSATNVIAAPYYWRAIGGGNWSNVSNWAMDAAGTIPAVTVPGVNDEAHFTNLGGGTVIFDLPTTIVQKLHVEPTFNGTLSISGVVTMSGVGDGFSFEMSSPTATVIVSGTGATFQAQGQFNMVEGLFELGGTGAHYIWGNFTMNGPGDPSTPPATTPTFNLKTGATLTFGHDFLLRNPSTFYGEDNSTVIFQKRVNNQVNIDIGLGAYAINSLYNVTFDENANSTNDNRRKFESGAKLYVRNDVLIQSGRLTTGALVGGIVLSGDITTAGNMANVGGGGQSNALLEFVGTTNQTVSFASADANLWDGPVVFNKPAGNTSTVTLLAPWQLNGDPQNITFTNGRLITTSTNRLIIGAVTTTSGANNNSYVDGPVEKRAAAPLASTPFTFPIGNGGYYAPLRITGAGGINSGLPVVANYVAQYFHTNPDPSFPIASQNPLNPVPTGVSQTEYWTLDLVSPGTLPVLADNPNVWLSYESLRSGGINEPSSLGVAAWEDAATDFWTYSAGTLASLGGVNFVGAGPLGTVDQTGALPAFTLASTNPTLNPLPVNWLSFSGRYYNNAVELSWSTAMELNNEAYTIERSADGRGFNGIGIVAGRGNTTTTSFYNFTDAQPLNGAAFYRIRQTDRDGKTSYSKVIRVSNTESVSKGVRMYPNPLSGNAPITLENSSWSNKIATITLYNAVGGIEYQAQLTFGSDSRLKLNLPSLAKGNYFLTTTVNGEKQTLPLIVQ